MKRKTSIITFEAPTDLSAVLHARVGIGNREIARLTGLSDGQITYRLTKAKRVSGNAQGFRVSWRNGNDPLLGRIMRDYAHIMAREVERKITARIVHPTPRIRE